MSLLNYKIINDIDILKDIIDENNIIIMNWSSSNNYAYLNNNEIVVNRLNINIINSLDKLYILEIGDTPISKQIKTPILKYEDEDKLIFNFIKQS